MIGHVASFLPLKDLHRFKQVSQRGCTIFKSMVYGTDFLTSDMPYARDVRSIFKDVTFEPMPEAIRWVFFIDIDNNGSIEVHFRDPKHLRKIGEKTPLIHTAGRIYFVHNPVAEDGEGIRSSRKVIY